MRIARDPQLSSADDSSDTEQHERVMSHETT
jgi:hypothetical protein